MLDNIYFLYKIVIFIFFKRCMIKNYSSFYDCYFRNFSIVSCVYQNKENLQQEDSKKISVNYRDGDVNRDVYKNSIYKVKPGDTLFYVAWITGDNYLNLAKKNYIKNINVLKVNQVLKVKRNFIRSLFYKNLPRKILLLWYKDHYKIDKLFFLFKKNNLSEKINRNMFYPATKIYNNFSSSKRLTVKTLSNWHWPTNGLVINTFSELDGGNKGIDISGRFDQPVLATTNGKVMYVGNLLKGYGNLVVIKHGNNYFSTYAHNNKILVTEQQQVKIGEQIATMGNSGTNEVKLHFEIRYKGKSIDPLYLLP